MVNERFVEKFLKTINPECPSCGSSNIDTDWKEGENDEVIVEHICEDCGSEWEKHYKFVDEYMGNKTAEGKG